MEYLIHYIIAAIILSFVTFHISQTKFNKRQRLINLGITLIIIGLLVMVNYGKLLGINIFDQASANYLIKTFIVVMVTIFYIKTNYKISYGRLIILGLVYYLTSLLTSRVAHNFYLDLIYYFYYLTPYAQMIVNLIANAINALIWLIIIKVINERQNYHSLISYLPLVLASITIAIILYMMNNSVSNLTNLSFIIIIILLNYLIIYIYMKNMSKLQKELANKRFEVERNYYQDKLELQMNNYNRSFAFVHDLIYKLKDIETAIKHEDLKTIDHEIKDLHSNLLKEFNIMYTSSKTISLVLSNHLNEIAANEIKIKTTIKYSDFTFLDEIDALKLFDKAICYAIKACIKTKADYKFINLATENKNASIIIKLIFSKNNDEFNDELLDDLKLIIDKYHGRYFEEYNHEETYAMINLAFNLSDVHDLLAYENRI